LFDRLAPLHDRRVRNHVRGTWQAGAPSARSDPAGLVDGYAGARIQYAHVRSRRRRPRGRRQVVARRDVAFERGGRRMPSDHFALETAQRQLPDMGAALGGLAACLRTEVDAMLHHPRGFQLALVDLDQVALHALAGGELSARHGAEGARHPAIDVAFVAHGPVVAIVAVVVVDVVDDRDVGDVAGQPDVADVDALIVVAIATIPGVVDLARTERKPADRPAADAY